MILNGQDNSKKALVIGLDGVPFSLLKKYLASGYLPELEKILGSGHTIHQMDASIPDVSSTSWTSFMTGVNPGEHGIFGFMDLSANSYQICFPNSNDIKAPTIWEMVGQTARTKGSKLFTPYRSKLKAPLKSIVMNVPQTFPAQRMNGSLSAGFVCPDLRKGTYPEKLYDYLTSIGYIPDVDSEKAIEAPEFFFKQIFLALEKRALAYETLLAEEPWSLFIGVITETDRLHHFFFDAATDPDHRYHSTFLSFYKKLDNCIGNLYSRFMEKTQHKGFFMIMSDHGFTKIKKEVNLNKLLIESGFLRLKNNGEYFHRIDSGSRAFVMDPGRVYINFKDKYPRGVVEKAEKNNLLNELKKNMASLKDEEGSSVIKAIYQNEEIYSGPWAGNGPDLVCLGHDGYDLKGTLAKKEVFGKSPFAGMHTQYDAHCILPERTSVSDKLNIENPAKFILDYFTS